ncbi:RdgB/HAM1 family non-canonical purine NTP pyrophosphatase [Aliidiomarina haloalkalitolerans]|uniref:dITP/XTP pyrophosphatase n=1 Tax=Aliidiomarina haloalkalitolerans TaxID=859059 RepID=A0A432VQB9_9GAMM|nr:RdgB/HAM1 family non-canonical purine NTP pyrophosphatase [Aliidiomarina haloalkalitolerans]RUO18378.1 non-canonical purine NTP pyrophosphatase, RdgB/HAM1 family [Aliidiomarina haloalkalitolerans]
MSKNQTIINSTPKDLVLATGNQGKLAELSALLSPLGWQVRAQTELGVTDADETGLTFIENAILKARHACAATGKPALADDSGLAVDYLGGAPGIYSARYAQIEDGVVFAQADNNGEALTKDQANIAKVLAALEGVPSDQRRAQFHCVLVYMRSADDPTPIVCHGVWPGYITETASGTGGFGYDPIFFVPEHQCTAAELPRTLKSEISHRGQALAALLKQLQ